MTPVAIPRALHLTTLNDGGGTERNVERLVEAVDEFESLSVEKLAGHPVATRKLPQAIKKLRGLGPDVVFCYGATAHMLASTAWPKKSEMPIIGNIRCTTDFIGKRRPLLPILDRRVSFWISNSQSGLEKRKGRVIYNGISVPEDETPLFADLPRPVYGVLGRGHPKKGHHFLLDIWAQLKPEGTLIFAGSLPPELEQRARSQKVLTPGFVESGPFLKSLDLLLLPSQAEGFPTVVLEAMIRKVPVLSTPVGALPEAIESDKDGYLRKRKDWLNFLKDIDWNEAKEVGERGYETALHRFSFERMKQEFIEAAQAAVKKRMRKTGRRSVYL